MRGPPILVLGTLSYCKYYKLDNYTDRDLNYGSQKHIKLLQIYFKFIIENLLFIYLKVSWMF